MCGGGGGGGGEEGGRGGGGEEGGRGGGVGGRRGGEGRWSGGKKEGGEFEVYQINPQDKFVFYSCLILLQDQTKPWQNISQFWLAIS